MRSRVRHERWLASLPCPVIRLEEDLAVEEQVAAALRRLDELQPDPTGMRGPWDQP